MILDRRESRQAIELASASKTMSGPSMYRMASSQSGSSFSGGSSHSMRDNSRDGSRGAAIDEVESALVASHRHSHNVVASAHHHQHHTHHHSHHSSREGRSSSSSIATGTNGIVKSQTAWFQRKIHLRPALRGAHLITDELLKQLSEMSEFAVGLCHIQIMHTSASLALNEVRLCSNEREQTRMFDQCTNKLFTLALELGP